MRVTSNPLMLSMVISIYEMNEGRGMPTTVRMRRLAGRLAASRSANRTPPSRPRTLERIGPARHSPRGAATLLRRTPPRCSPPARRGRCSQVWELYDFASKHMLERLGASTAGMTEEGFGLSRVVESIFFQAHASQARVIIDEHLHAAALGLHAPAELSALQGHATLGAAADDEHDALTASFTKSFAKEAQRRGAIERACERLPDDLKALMQSVRDRVCQDRLPLFSLLQPDPLQMQSSHLSFQEFYTAKALSSGVYLLPAHAAEPWRWSAWWSNTLRLGLEMGERFARGLLAAMGLAVSEVRPLLSSPSDHSLFDPAGAAHSAAHSVTLGRLSTASTCARASPATGQPRCSPSESS